MTIELQISALAAAPASATPVAPSGGRLTPRSSIAVADVELARNTLANLLEPQPFEEAGERVLARLRRFVIGHDPGLDSRS